MPQRLKVFGVCLLVIGCNARKAKEPAHAPAAPTTAAAPAGPAPSVHGSCPADAIATTDGCVRGEHAGTLAVFRGIPYAAPPTGAQRWRPPQPPAAWQDVRDATHFGKACPQLESPISGKLDWSEDCLTLNVWAPAERPKAKLPVMVWIHGGGLVQGASSLPYYDGTQLATQGRVVLVSLNYRLGPFGFLAHPAMTAEDPHHASGNLGLLDQIAALEWVKANVAAFGGDPGNVTIFGESAGGESVCALMASPLAHHLFARAVIESAQCVGYGKPLRSLHGKEAKESGEDQGLRIAHALGCDGDGALACLRGKPADEILRASPAAFGFLGKGEHYGMTVDGHVLTDAPANFLAAGKLAAVPLIIGTTANEATLFTGKVRIERPLVYAALVAKMFPGSARQILAHYAPAMHGGVKQAFDALVTDVVFACPTRRAARALAPRQPHVYRYVFAHVTQANADKHAGATHGSEIPFVFASLGSPTDPERSLAQTMVGYWTRFAHTGDPNGGGAPAWPAYDPATDSYLELETPIAAKAGLHTAACDTLDAVTAGAQLEHADDE